MEDALMAICWLVTAGHLQHSCRQFCRHNAGGGPLMEGILGREGVCGGEKIFGSTVLRPSRSVCVSSERFFQFALCYRLW